MSSVPSDPTPGRSGWALGVPVNSVYLARVLSSARLTERFIYGHGPEAPLELMKILGDCMEVQIEEDGMLPPSGSNPPVDSIADYIQMLKAEEKQSPLLTLDLRKETAGGELYFGVVLDGDFIGKLGVMLRSPSLIIRGTVEVPFAHYDPPRMNMDDDDGGGDGHHRGMMQLELNGWVNNWWSTSPQQYQLERTIKLEGGMKLDHRVSGLISTEGLALVHSKTSVNLSVAVAWEGESDAWKALYKENDKTALKDKDVTIVVGNGAEVKCHKFILTAQSPVLATMLSIENGWTEGQSGRMEWRENSEEGVGYLLRYLYGMKVTTEGMDCEVAVELLKTAHRYELKQLESCLRERLLHKGREWYGPDVILELYFFARNVDRFWELRDHIFNTMKNMSTAIRSCDGFKELGQDEARHLECKLFGYPISSTE